MPPENIGLPGAWQMLDVEVQQQRLEIERTCAALKAQLDRWSRPGVFVVCDTTFYIHHPEKLSDAELQPLLQIWHDPVHRLIRFSSLASSTG